VVAVDTPANLTARLTGAETMYVQLDSLGAEAGPVLASIAGVTRVVASDSATGGFEVESERGTDIRRDLARTIVQRGWGLLELRPMRMSLEEIFLQVTTDETAGAAAPENSESDEQKSNDRDANSEGGAA
jgi:ABC-2 type transport system ATP-binding protein